MNQQFCSRENQLLQMLQQNEKSTQKRNWIWDVLDIDWKEVRVTLNGNEVSLPTSVAIPFRDKFVTRCLITKQPLLLHAMLKQGKMWFTLENDNRNNSPVTGTA